MSEQAVTIAVATPEVVRTHLDAICDLYVATFSAAPFEWPEGEEEHHRAMMGRLIDDPTFGVALALTEDEEHLVGFVYGYTLGTSTNWWQGFTTPVPEETTKEWPGRTIAVIDLAVRDEWRRRGLGSGLLEELLASREEERATLAVQPQATETHAFYRAVGGWDLVGQQHVPDMGFTNDRFDIYVKALGAEVNP